MRCSSNLRVDVLERPVLRRLWHCVKKAHLKAPDQQHAKRGGHAF